MLREVTTPAPDEVIEILKARNIDPTPDAIRSFYLHWTLDSIRAKFDRNSYREEGRVEVCQAIKNFMKTSGLTSITMEQLSQLISYDKDNTLAGSGLNHA